MLIAIIRHGVLVSRDRYRHLVRVRRDRQRSRIRRRNFIFIRRVNRANRTLRKRYRIFADILSRSARFGNIVKGDVFLRADVARFNRLRFSIIRHRVAVRRQLDVLIIVEIDLVLFRPNRDRLGIIRYRRVALGSDGGFRRLCPKRLASNGLGRLDKNFSSVPVVVHRVAQVGLRLKLRRERRVLIQLIPIICKVQFFLSLCRVKSGVVPYLIASLVPANEIITGFRRGFHSRQSFACYLAHRLLCVSFKCSAFAGLIGNGNCRIVRLVVYINLCCSVALYLFLFDLADETISFKVSCFCLSLRSCLTI